MNYIPDLLWSELKKHLPRKNNNLGRPNQDNRKAMNGIFYVLLTGCQWSALPREYGSKSTVHGKLMKWLRNGVFSRIMASAREYYLAINHDNNWFAYDTISVKAPLANFSGKNPTDRGKRGIKRGVVVDRKGAPLFVHITAANTHDSETLEPILQQIPVSSNIKIMATDSAFDVKKLYLIAKEKNIALIASTNPRRDKTKHKFHAPYRWIVEQALGIFSSFRGLKICWNKTIESAMSFFELACSYRLFKMAGLFG